MHVLRSLAQAFILLALVITTAHADDSSSTFVRLLENTPKGPNALFAIPRDLDLEKKITIVVYFHGLRGDEKFEDVLARQRVAEQVAEAHVNAILIAPSIDYSTRLRCTGKKKKRCKKIQNSGPFSEKGSFKKFLKDSVAVLAKSLDTTPNTFAGARIVVIGYSAGHNPLRKIFSDLDVRLDGVVLLDAHYGSQDVFAQTAARIARRGTGFFVTARSRTQDERGGQFEDALAKEKIAFVRRFPSGHLESGLIVAINVDGDHRHHDFVTNAWTDNPITDILKKAYE